MRPGDGSPERLLARIGIAVARQDVETPTEPLEELLGREEASAGCGQFKRQRQVVEPLAELLHRSVRGEGRIHGTGASVKEADAVLIGEGRHWEGLLASDPQPFSARHYESQCGNRRAERCQVACETRQQMLGVVEHEQHAFAGECRSE